MKTYYNEIDAYCVAWLRNLMQAGLIAAGDVDDRSIADVGPGDLVGYGRCHFFAGIGGWDHALRLAGWPDGREAWTGSCPCQPFSVAGRQRGFADERHLWPEFHRLIAERRPATVFGEQVASASAWLAGVRGDLEALGYAVGAAPIEAASVGAPHKRDRYWFVADADRQPGQQVPRSTSGDEAADGGAGWHVRESDGDHRPSGNGEGALADADQPGASEARQQRGGELGGLGGDPSYCAVGHAQSGVREERPRESDASSRCSPRGPDGSALGDASGAGLALRSIAEDEPGDVRGEGATAAEAGSGGPWGRADLILGADGKARRVEPGIRLLAHGVPARVAKLRALGNAIVPQAGAAFVQAYLACRP